MEKECNHPVTARQKEITIKDVAKEAGVSIATVSRALNGQNGISESTRKYVLDICQKISYTPNAMARNLVMQKTETIGIIVPDIMSPFYAEIMVRAEEEAGRKGYQVLLCNSFRSFEKEESYINLLMSNRVEGILIWPVGETSTKTLQRYSLRIPIVSLNRIEDDSNVPYVCTDERLSGRIATEYLISRGCQNLIFIGMKWERFSHKCRAESFLEVAKEYGVQAEIWEGKSDYRTSFERGYNQFLQLIQSGEKIPDGIVAASDATANGVVKAARECGLEIPTDFSIIGFDNISNDLPYIELSTVGISRKEQVLSAIDILERIRDNRKIPIQEQRVMLVPRLIERKSCK